MKEHPSGLVDNQGFTQEQQFFVSFYQIWRSKARDELKIKYISIDSHSPTEFRADGTLANFAPFH
jgi:putative endopeptidase